MITLHGVEVRYGDVVALAGLDLAISPGEWIGLVGPSGSGKTSALRAIAGFERVAAGRITIDGEAVAEGRHHRPPEKRGVGFVFQDFALFPHLTVARNVAFGLRRLDAATRAARVDEVLALVELDDYRDRLPSALSGGQQQRVALARALAPAPRVLLMDEPFGSLDPALREVVRERVAAALRARGCTVVFISHDVDEALCTADRLALLRDGHLEQLGAPEALYARPESAFAARFFGPAALVAGVASGGRVLDTALGTLTLARPAEGAVRAVIRPHMLQLGAEGVDARIVRRVYRGHEARLWVACGDETFQISAPPDDPARPGDAVRLSVNRPVETIT